MESGKDYMDQGSQSAVVGDVVGAEVSGAILSQVDLAAYVRALYGDLESSPCPFTAREISELARTNEMLVYVPKQLTADQMCRMWGFRSNVDFGADKLIRYTMTT